MRKLYPNLSQGRYLLLEQEIAAARRSLYFWWWRYLRLSSDYWWLCQQQGKTSDKKFASVYRDFGDVFTRDFDEWWAWNGTKIFSFKLEPPRVGWLSGSEIDELGSADWVHFIKIPRFLTKSQILSQLGQLLGDHQPMPYPRSIATEHEVGDLRGVRKPVLIDMHRVWCLNDALQREKEAGRLDRPERYTQQWIGRKLGILPKTSEKKNRTLKVEANERLAIRVKINRYLSKANLIIRNVEIGNFPIFEEIAEVKRWTAKQLADKKKAIGSGPWTCPESVTQEVLGLLK